MVIVWSGLAPHPPVLVPQVGKARSQDVIQTRQAMQDLIIGFLRTEAERLVVISPHTPRPQVGISAWFTPTLAGHFADFGARDCGLSLPNDDYWLQQFASQFPAVTPLATTFLDHGAMVPLFFFFEAGWRGPTIVLGLPWADEKVLTAMGKAIAICSSQTPTGLLASGDMSHCLAPGAPAGYDPIGQIFDQTFVDLIQQRRFREVCQMDPDLLERAKQDVFESCRVVWEATGYTDHGAKFHSYECPFGVGYSVMQFHEVGHGLV